MLYFKHKAIDQKVKTIITRKMLFEIKIKNILRRNLKRLRMNRYCLQYMPKASHIKSGNTSMMFCGFPRPTWF